MSFNKNTTNPKSTKQYSIALKTTNGNTVGFINLSTKYIKAVIGKQPETVTATDVFNLNGGDFQGYLDTLLVEVTETVPEEKIAIEDY